MADRTFIAEAVEVLMRDPALPRPVVILEAGCGSASEVVLPFEKRIVGIDIDRAQLEHNDLVEKIEGDLQTYDLPQNAFDLVACVDVLEHLPFPEKALANMSRSLKPGGYLLVASDECVREKGADWPKLVWILDMRREERLDLANQRCGARPATRTATAANPHTPANQSP